MARFKQVKLEDVQGEEIIKKGALRQLMARAKVKDYHILSNTYTNKTIGYDLILEDDTWVHVKANKKGTALLEKLCKLGNCEYWRVSEEGTQKSQMIGSIIKPIN